MNESKYPMLNVCACMEKLNDYACFSSITNYNNTEGIYFPIINILR